MNNRGEEALFDKEAPPVEVRGLVSRFGDNTIHDNLDLVVNRGEIVGVVGGSVTGKSVLMNTVIGLRQAQGGSVKIFGQDIRHAGSAHWSSINRRWGVLFQQGALWSNLTIKENDKYQTQELRVGGRLERVTIRWNNGLTEVYQNERNDSLWYSDETELGAVQNVRQWRIGSW